MSSVEDVAASLRSWFAARLETDDVEISELKRHAEGWSWHTYTMAVSWRDASGESRHQGFAVRREPEHGLLAPYDTRRQYELHRAIVEHSAVPMPRLHWLEMGTGVLGMPFYVMERMGGVVPVQWQGRDPNIFPDDGARRAIGQDFVDVLAQIHSIDLDTGDFGFLDQPATSDEAAIAQIDHWERVYEESVLVEVPLIRTCLAWLRANVATSGRVALVHGDYRIGNFMLGADRRINAVFDWELAHLGDPVFDVAWAGMPLFRGRSPLMSQLLDRGEFFERYEQRTDHAVDAETFRFWTVFGHLRASVPHISATRAFADGRARDLRLAAMGHQNLYVLKQLVVQLGIAGSKAPTVFPGSAAGTGSMQNSIESIIECIGSTLTDVVVPVLEDPYAEAQVRAAVELLNNLATRVVWNPAPILETIRRIRELGAAVANVPEEVAGVIDGDIPPATDAVALCEAERVHRAAVATLQRRLSERGDRAGLDLLTAFATWDLERELGLLRSGMYRKEGA